VCFKKVMDPATVIGIFLLAASTGSFLTMIRFRSELAEIRARLDRIQKQKAERQEAA
jgi:hypothetical protein